MMGTIVDPDWIIKSEPKAKSKAKIVLPESFDAREQWKECADVIGHVRD
jgi:hypothetical protein